MAVRSHGTFLQIGDGAASGETFITVSEVLDISGPGMVLAVEPLRGDGVETVAPAGTEPGEVTFDVNYTGHETQLVLRGAIADQLPLSFRIVFPTDPAETLAFRGYVTAFSFSAPVAGLLRASLTLTLASAMVFS